MPEKLGNKTMYVICDNLCLDSHGMMLLRKTTWRHPRRKQTSESSFRLIMQLLMYRPSSWSLKIQTKFSLPCLSQIYTAVCMGNVKQLHEPYNYISISKVSAALDHDVSASLLGLHSFTGCDSVRACSGRGKLAALKLLMTHSHFRSSEMFLSNLVKSGS